MRQFDTMSYAGLTRCVRARIQWIREYNRFLEDEHSKNYEHIRSTIVLSKLTAEHEINELLRMRRILKASPLRNWNTDYFKGGH